MTPDQVARAHARGRERRVRDLELRVRQAARQSGRAWLDPRRADLLAAQLAAPMPRLAAAELADYVAYAGDYAVVQGAQPPQTAITLPRQADQDAGHAAALAALMLAVVESARRKRYSPARRDGVVTVTLAGEVSRRVLQPAHAWEYGYLTRDPTVRAYRRVTDSDPCAFCAMLATRGYVYRTKRDAGDVRVIRGWHRKCACTSQPLLVGQEAGQLDPVARRAQEIYAGAKLDGPGDSKLRAFRRAWEEAGRK